MLSKAVLALAALVACAQAAVPFRREDVEVPFCGKAEAKAIETCFKITDEKECQAASSVCKWCGPDVSPLFECAPKKATCALPIINVPLKDGTRVDVVNVFLGSQKKCPVLDDMSEDLLAAIESKEYPFGYLDLISMGQDNAGATTRASAEFVRF